VRHGGQVSKAALLFVCTLLGIACATADLTPLPADRGTPHPGPAGEVVVDGGQSFGDAQAGDAHPTPSPQKPASERVTIQIGPGDMGAQVEAAIRAAKRSVHMTMYILTNTSVIDALGDLKDAGKDVKVVLNKTFPPDGGDNAQAFAKLQARRVPVVYASPAYAFTHAKTILIDDETLLVMTMNLTKSPTNREYIATDSDPADVADAETMFAADFKGETVRLDGKLVVSPQVAQPIDARTRLRSLIESATTSLDVEVQSLSDTALTDAILAVHAAHVPVRVVLSGDATQTPAETAMITKMKAAGVPLKGVKTPYIHAKAIVVDGKRAYVGSHNFTPTALVQNREVGVVFESSSEATKMVDVIAKDFASETAF
jgi:phosphatidylserine/phosphatidylglycerophosphate/cardiolipin synthase-like enzyme